MAFWLKTETKKPSMVGTFETAAEGFFFIHIRGLGSFLT